MSSSSVSQLEAAEEVTEQLGYPGNVTVTPGHNEDGDHFLWVRVDAAGLSGGEVDELVSRLEAVCLSHTVEIKVTGDAADVGFFVQTFANSDGEWRFADFEASACAGPM